MRMRACAILGFALCLAAGSARPVAAQQGPRELYQALNALRVDPSRVYYVRDLNLRRDAVSFSLSEGKLAFLASLDGRVTGAVFIGRGRVIATPRDPGERRSLAQFLGVPLLDQSFSRAYLRFTDDFAAELGRQLEQAGTIPSSEPGFASSWDATLANLNPGHSLRVMEDWLSEKPRPYFYAALAGETSSPFDVLVDYRREEPVLFGQPRLVGGTPYFDVWASFAAGGPPENWQEDFAPLDYEIATNISVDGSLEGKTKLHLKAVRGHERVISLELSRLLKVESVTDADGHPFVFFQNEDINRADVARLGNDAVLVVLPKPAQPGEELQLRLSYRGSVISDAGNGVYFVGERGSWYPHLGGADHFVSFDLNFRWPRRLTLVATGNKLEEHDEGEVRSGHWRSGSPISVAGFNLGEYVTQTVGASPRIDLYANRQLEDAILARLHEHEIVLPPLPPPDYQPPAINGPPSIAPEPPEPRPAAVLKQLGGQVLDSIHFFETFNGPFPFDRLEVSQIPGSFGQGWPGLLYLSTLVFLPPEAQERAGATRQIQEQITELVPFHETAHQWWGNVVGTASYRDAWIEEAMANYLAVLYADSKKPSEHALTNWLDRYRTALLADQPSGDALVDDAGPLSLGYRLNSSKSPGAFEAIIYGKGTWVVHMLRMMLRDPAAKNPDARFADLLRGILSGRRYHALSTADLEHAVDKIMTPAMDLEGNRSIDWFFDEWVRGTGIPHYAVQFQARPRGADYLVTGTLRQSDVPETFLAAVPLYAARPGGKPALLGTVIASGPETRFHFVTHFAPRHISIDPQHTLLCRTD